MKNNLPQPLLCTLRPGRSERLIKAATFGDYSHGAVILQNNRHERYTVRWWVCGSLVDATEFDHVRMLATSAFYDIIKSTLSWDHFGRDGEYHYSSCKGLLHLADAEMLFSWLEREIVEPCREFVTWRRSPDFNRDAYTKAILRDEPDTTLPCSYREAFERLGLPPTTPRQALAPSHPA